MTEMGLYLTAVLLGLTGSLHCAAMCGPIYWAVSGFYDKPKDFITPLVRQLLGKTVGYVMLGVLFGIAGKGLSMLFFQNTLMIVSGTLLMVVGLNGLFKFKGFSAIEHTVNRGMGRLISQKGKGAFLLGFLNGFLPCGLVYAAGIGAMASGSPETGAVYMVLFGVGTAPVLIFSAFSRWLLPLRKKATNLAWKQIPVMIIGLLFLLKGVGFGIPYLSPDLKSPSAQKNCCAPKVQGKPSDVSSP